MSGVAKLIAGIGLNTDEFKNGISEVKNETEGTKANFAGLKTAIAGAFSVGAVVAFVKSIKDYAGAVADAASTTGSSATAIQALNAAAVDNASSSEKMRAGLEKVRSAQIDALGGNEKLAETFGKLGIAMSDIEGVGADRVFELIGQSIVNAENPTTALSAASQILGKELTTKLLPALNAVGSEGLDALTARMIEAGRVMDEAMIAKIDVMGDRWEELKTKLIVGSVSFIESSQRVIAGIQSMWENGFNAENYRAGFDELAALQETATRRAVEAAREANRLLLEEEKNKWSGIQGVTVDRTDYLAKIRAQYAKEAADAEIAEAKRSAAEQVKALDDLARERERYARESISTANAALSPEERLNQLRQQQVDIQSAINTQEADGRRGSKEWYDLQTNLLLVEKQIKEAQDAVAKSAEEGGRKQAEAAAFTGGIPNESPANARQYGRAIAEMVKELQKMGEIPDLSNLAALSDFNIPSESAQNARQFGRAISALVKELQNMGNIPDLSALQILSDFNIPNESVRNAAQFGRAIAAMVKELQNMGNIPDLSALDALKDFNIPNESVQNARQFGRAIAEMVGELQNLGSIPDLSSITDLLDSLQNTPASAMANLSAMLSQLSGGSFGINLIAPPADQLQLTVDEGFKHDLSSIASSVQVLAQLEGIIYR